MRQKHLMHNLFIAVSGSASFELVASCVTTVLQFLTTFLLEYYEAQIQMLLVFSWKPALEMPRYVKLQIFLFLKARV